MTQQEAIEHLAKWRRCNIPDPYPYGLSMAWATEQYFKTLRANVAAVQSMSVWPDETSKPLNFEWTVHLATSLTHATIAVLELKEKN